MASDKRYYYKTKDGKGLLELKSKLKPLPEDYEEITEEEFLQLENVNSQLVRDPRKVEISQLKAQLKATDYKVAKRTEGYYTDEEWETICAQRMSWRDRINQLEDELENDQN